MYLTKCLRLLWPGLLAVFALPCLAQGKLNYFFVDFPPFHYHQPDDPAPRGLTLELLQLAAAQVGEQVHFQEVPLNRYIQLTKAGKLDIAVVTLKYRDAFAEHLACSPRELTRMHPLLQAEPPPFPVGKIALSPIGISLCVNANLAQAATRQQALERAFLQVAHSPRGRALLEQYGLSLVFTAVPE